MSNKIKRKKTDILGVESTDAESRDFKFSDHIVLDPLKIIGELSINETISPTVNLKKINSVIYFNYPNFKGNKKKNIGVYKYSKKKTTYVNKNIPVPTFPAVELESDDLMWSNEDELEVVHTIQDPSNTSIIRTEESFYSASHISSLSQERIISEISLIQSSILGIKYKLDLTAGQIQSLSSAINSTLIPMSSNTLNNYTHQLEFTQNNHGGYLSLLARTEEYLDLLYQFVMQINPSHFIKTDTKIGIPSDRHWSIEKEKKSIFQKLEAALYVLKMETGYNPALVKGYIFEDKVITDNEELDKYLKEIPVIDLSKVKTIIKVFRLEKDKVESKLVTSSQFKFMPLSKQPILLSILPLLVKFKVVGCKNSNRFFSIDGKNKEREALVDLETMSWSIESINIVREKTKLSTYVINVQYVDQEVRFLLSDCKFTNQSAVGYNLPIDKTISIRSIVAVKDNKKSKYGIPKEQSLADVVSIKPNPSSKRIFSNCKNHRMDIVTISIDGKLYTVYAQDLKFIENKKKENVNAKKETSKQKISIEDYYHHIPHPTYSHNVSFPDTF